MKFSILNKSYNKENGFKIFKNKLLNLVIVLECVKLRSKLVINQVNFEKSISWVIGFMLTKVKAHNYWISLFFTINY
jgi:hypothetical protein